MLQILSLLLISRETLIKELLSIHLNISEIPQEVSLKHRQMPNPLNWLLLMWRTSGSSVLLHPLEQPAACICDLILLESQVSLGALIN